MKRIGMNMLVLYKFLQGVVDSKCMFAGRRKRNMMTTEKNQCPIDLLVKSSGRTVVRVAENCLSSELHEIVHSFNDGGRGVVVGCLIADKIQPQYVG